MTASACCVCAPGQAPGPADGHDQQRFKVQNVRGGPDRVLRTLWALAADAAGLPPGLLQGHHCGPELRLQNVQPPAAASEPASRAAPGAQAVVCMSACVPLPCCPLFSLPVCLWPWSGMHHPHACAHARMHARTYARTHARTHARMHARTHARMHARMHACTHACTHARMHACMHACTHAHALPLTHAPTHPPIHPSPPSPTPPPPTRSSFGGFRTTICGGKRGSGRSLTRARRFPCARTAARPTGPSRR